MIRHGLPMFAKLIGDSFINFSASINLASQGFARAAAAMANTFDVFRPAIIPSIEGGMFWIDLILENPADKDTRMIAADWFEERGKADFANALRDGRPLVRYFPLGTKLTITPIA